MMNAEKTPTEFERATLLAVSGCERESFKAMTRLNGLLARPVRPGERRKFDLVDACVARTVKILTDAGYETSVAVAFAQDQLRPLFEAHVSGWPTADRLIGLLRLDGGVLSHIEFPNRRLTEVVAHMQALGGGIYLLDTGAIFRHVHETLKKIAMRAE
jgi:hypothetical protein